MEFKNFKNLLNKENKQKIKSKSERIIIAILIILFIALISAFNSVSTTEEVENVEEKEREAGDLNEEWNAQEMPILTESESHQRFIELCEKYNLPADVIWHTENFYWLKEGTILCIAIAETSGWKNGWGKPWCWNYWNVWNNDWGDRHCFPNQWAWLAAIWKTLNNSLLWPNKTISCLNWAGNCVEPYATWYRYSTGKSWNWERNMIACFHSIYKTQIDPTTFNIHNR